MPNLFAEPAVAKKLEQAANVSTTAVDMAIRYIYADELPGSLEYQTRDPIPAAQLMCELVTIFQTLGLRNACESCLVVAQLVLRRARSQAELVAAVELVLTKSTPKLFEALTHALIRSRSPLILDHLEKLKQSRGVEVFDEAIAGLKNQGTSHKKNRGPKPELFVSTMSNDFLAELERADTPFDYTLKVATGEKIKVHKAVLAARWPFFNSMFSSGMKESRSSEYKFGVVGESENGLSFSAVTALVKFFYSGSTRFMTDLDDCVQILSTADYFGLAGEDEELQNALLHC